MTGTTSTSGWAVFLFLLGFTVVGTSAVGGGLLSWLGGGVLLAVSAALFKTARAKEAA